MSPKTPEEVAEHEAKVAHVMQSRQTRKHTCHWPGCKAQVPPAMWGCYRHWMKLPKFLRSQVWAAYRPGQEDDLKPSEQYLAVMEEVQNWIREHLKGQGV